jgi:hypothetical protein
MKKIGRIRANSIKIENKIGISIHISEKYFLKI